MKTLILTVLISALCSPAFASIETSMSANGDLLFASTATAGSKADALAKATDEARAACLAEARKFEDCKVVHTAVSKIMIQETHDKLCGLLCFMTGSFIDSSPQFKTVTKKGHQAVVIVKNGL